MFDSPCCVNFILSSTSDKWDLNGKAAKETCETEMLQGQIWKKLQVLGKIKWIIDLLDLMIYCMYIIRTAKAKDAVVSSRQR
jgi:hypothetical protein